MQLKEFIQQATQDLEEFEIWCEDNIDNDEDELDDLEWYDRFVQWKASN